MTCQITSVLILASVSLNFHYLVYIYIYHLHVCKLILFLDLKQIVHLC